LLLSPTKGQYASDQYNPIQDILATIQAIIVFCFTPRAKDIFESLITSVSAQDSSPPSPIANASSPKSSTSISAKDSSQSSLRLFSVSSPFIRKLERAKNRRDGDLFLHLLQQFNSVIRKMKKMKDSSGDVLAPLNTPTPHEMISHILYQVYSRVVAPQVDLLKNYKG
jgi:hypothetical protein